jgi:bcr-type benzoyl-CoA reductase subunit C
MSKGNNMFEPFHEIINNVSSTITHYEKELERPVIGVMPAYFPMELAEAAGGYPVQLWGNNLLPGKSDAYLQSFCCSVGRSVLELEMMGGAPMVKAYVFTSICDTLVNLKEIYSSLFPEKPSLEFSIPMTQTTEARKSYFKSVLEDIQQGLEGVTGEKLNHESLRKASLLHGETRRLQRKLYTIRRKNPGLIKNHDFYAAIKAGFFMPKKIYNEMLTGLIKELEVFIENTKTANGPKVVLSGMLFDPLNLHQVMDDLSLLVVDDDFANGWRTVAKPDLQTDNLIEAVTRYAFEPAPCCCLYNPDLDRHEYLIQKVKDSGADGVLFWYTKFCEPDAFDRPQIISRLKEEGIPAAVIEIELSMTNFDSIKTRINAFREILEG